ncbi:MAG: PH domain-containing protein [Acidobacteria bacterium]|nr:PH domain-containing protein [Acidobacteriota bacterium]
MQTSSQQWSMLHPAMLVLELLRQLKQTAFGLVLGGYFAIKGNMFLLVFLIVFSIVVPLLVITLRFMSYRYALTQGHLVIKEGILSRKERSIPATRIHNINTTQSLIARAFGVVRVDLETAGGGQAEASLPAISIGAAEHLEAYIVANKGHVVTQPDGSETAQVPPIYQISFKDIVVLGATTNRMGVIFAGLYALLEFWEDDMVRATQNWISTAAQITTQFSERSHLEVVFAVVVSFLVILTLSCAISIGLALIQFYGFQVTMPGSDIKIRTGLFTVRSLTIPAGRIQALRFVTSAIRRPFNLLQVTVCTAGHMGVQEKQQQNQQQTDLLIPLAHQPEVNQYVQAIWPQAQWASLNWRKVDAYTRTRQFRWLWFGSSLIFAIAFRLQQMNLITALVLWVIAGILSWTIAHLTYKQTAFAVDARFVYIKTGFLGLRSWVIPLNRIQMLAVMQSPFQRRRELASLVLDVAGASRQGTPVIPNIEVAKAWHLFNVFSGPKPVTT